MLTYAFKQSALKDLKKLPKVIQKRIVGKLDYFVSSKNPLVFADKLMNSEIGQYRYRVGDYRIIFDYENNQIVILAVGHRKEIYR